MRRKTLNRSRMESILQLKTCILHSQPVTRMGKELGWRLPIRIHINDYILLFRYPRSVPANKTPFNSMCHGKAPGDQKQSSKQIVMSRTETVRSAIFIRLRKVWLQRILLTTFWTTNNNPSTIFKNKTTSCHFRALAARIQSLRGNSRFIAKRLSKTRGIWAWKGLSGSSCPRSTSISFRGVAQSSRSNQLLRIFSAPSTNAKELCLLATRIRRCSNKAVV